MSKVYSRIIEKWSKGVSQFVVLIDPEKSNRVWLEQMVDRAEHANVDMYFVGGSTYHGDANDVVDYIKSRSSKDVILFPGNISQLSGGVDAVLFLSLVSGRDAEFLIGTHVRAVPFLVDVEVISVGYVLIDGGCESAIERVTATKPMSPDDLLAIVHTAKASELLGHKLIYLEAGSGAMLPVGLEVISAVKAAISIPLIVGGGISSDVQLKAAYQAGADIVVVGNAFENDLSLFERLEF